MQMRVVLLKRFPEAFKPFGEPKTPFKVGIFEDVQAAAPELDPALVHDAIRDYASGRTYHQAAQEPGAVRIDLEGLPAGEVSPEQAGFHARHFERISARNAKRKAARASTGSEAA